MDTERLIHKFTEKRRLEIILKENIIILNHYMKDKRDETIEIGDVSLYPLLIKRSYKASEEYQKIK